MSSVAALDAEDLLTKLIHDLRQPLSTIENSAYLTQILLDSEQDRAREQLGLIQNQVDRAANLLSAAVIELVRIRSQRAAETDRSRTNAVTAAVR